jgi:cleavage and polyadenylation specificity factor subunit 3
LGGAGMIRDIVTRGGRCLLPVSTSGHAQELLLILDEYWEAHPELQRFPIYYASALANKCIDVYQTYVNMMNARIRRQFPAHNPFRFKHINNFRSRDHFDDTGPCVMLASPGMLQSGISRELFESWCTDPLNGVIIAGYSVEGTLAKVRRSRGGPSPTHGRVDARVGEWAGSKAKARGSAA